MKKFVSVLLSLSILFSLSACAVNVGDQSKPTTTTAPTREYVGMPPYVDFHSYEEIAAFKEEISKDGDGYKEGEFSPIWDLFNFCNWDTKQEIIEWFDNVEDFEMLHIAEESGYKLTHCKFVYESDKSIYVPDWIECTYQNEDGNLIWIDYYPHRKELSELKDRTLVKTHTIAGDNVSFYQLDEEDDEDGRMVGYLKTDAVCRIVIDERTEKEITDGFVKVTFGDLIDSHSSTPTE